jgi:cellulose synthase/poly-beta-1,6-N-acetylglucosamine synthase-like glycosyltransferase
MLIQVIADIVRILYLICLTGMAVFGLNNVVSTVLYLIARKRNPVLPRLRFEKLPTVTVQLPIFNERYMVKRLLKAVSQLDYPKGKLQVQVLDDSTDDTSLTVKFLVEQYQAKGMDFEWVHRTDRKGFKAGALKEGFETATGELIAIFDADFVPSRNWLMETVPSFADPKLGCLQTRWGHLNSKMSSFTRAVALGINGHFIVEQTARSRNGLFMNFNGSAGLWRRTCIVDSGGWQADTLTEDLDLSYRAQLRGWKVRYLPNVVVPGEIPAQIEAFKKQQFRWAKGSFQTVKKIVPQLMRADIPEPVRLLGFIHLTGYMVSPMMVGTLLLILPLAWLSPNYLRFLPWASIATLGPPLMYLVSHTEENPRWIDRLVLLPTLILIGFGISVNNSYAVFEGLFKKSTGEFVRTPKYSLTNTRRNWEDKKYKPGISPMVWIELLLAFYALLSIYLLTPKLGATLLPFLLAYFGGYIFIAGANILQNWQPVLRRITPSEISHHQS